MYIQQLPFYDTGWGERGWEGSPWLILVPYILEKETICHVSFRSPSEIQVPFDIDAIPNSTLLNFNYPPFQLARFLFAYFVRGYSLPSWT